MYDSQVRLLYFVPKGELLNYSTQRDDDDDGATWQDNVYVALSILILILIAVGIIAFAAAKKGS